jgi:glucokinase
LPASVAAMNASFDGSGNGLRRLVQRAYNFEDPGEQEMFLRGETRRLVVPGSSRRVQYDPLQRTAVGISRLGTSEAVSIGAYAFALSRLDI